MHLLKDHDTRTGIRFDANDDNNKAMFANLLAGFKKAAAFLSKLKPQEIMPPSIHIPRALKVDLDSDNSEEFWRPEKMPQVKAGQ